MEGPRRLSPAGGVEGKQKTRTKTYFPLRFGASYTQIRVHHMADSV